MFEDKYKAANDMLHPSDEANARVLSALNGAQVERTRRGGVSKGLAVGLAAAFCALLIIPAAVGIKKLANKGERDVKPANGNVLALSLPHNAVYGSDADDYKAVFARIEPGLKPYSANKNGFLSGIIEFFDGAKYEMTADAANEVPQAANPAYSEQSEGGMDYAESGDYSKTNVQVDGVDEADVVKTDGRYIYVLNNDGVTVLTAEGAESQKLSHIASEDMPKHSDGADVGFSYMYIFNDRLIVIAQEYVVSGLLYDLPEDHDIASDDCMIYGWGYWRGSQLTTVYVYDVEDAASPKLISTVCQDGGYSDSRMIDGKLYVITNYCPSGAIFEDVPCTYVPCTYGADGECKLTPAEDIMLPDKENGEAVESFVYVSALDTASPEDFTGTLAIMGSSWNVYCSKDNLYITAADYKISRMEGRFKIDEDGAEAWIADDGSVEGTLVEEKTTTVVYRVKIGGRQPVLEATGSFDGYLINQFALDEYNGHLRAAAIRDSWSYIEVLIPDGDDTDGATFVSYGYDSQSQNDNVVYVLDTSLNTVGTLGGLGKGERIKSVRFMGDTGYVVTFRQTDPLYSIDLSVPAAPKVLGALKIPGFSEYMHPWSGDMLFGLGQMAEIETGGVQGVKLSMFDISDKSDVKELFCKHLSDVGYSLAEYDHKAILVSPDRGLIGFPGDWNRYLLFGYDDENGFVEKAEIKLNEFANEWYGSDLRGMYVGSSFYVIDREACNMYVIDLETCMLSGSVSFK